VAGDFNRYDEHAVAQINRSIESFRYRHYGIGLLALELVATAGAAVGTASEVPLPASATPAKTVAQYYAQSPQALKDLCAAVEAFIVGLGDDVTKKETQQVAQSPAVRKPQRRSGRRSQAAPVGGRRRWAPMILCRPRVGQGKGLSGTSRRQPHGR